MAQDTQRLRELLSQYIGDVYAEALQYTDDPAAAKEVTRRVMTLLKRSQEAGLAVNPSMARRLTEDCCREREYYENRRATFVNGTIADMPDFDTALSEISPAEVQARARSEAETKAAEAHAAIRAAEAMGAKVITSKPAPSPGASIHSNPEVIDLNEFDDEDDELDYGDEYDEEENSKGRKAPQRKAQGREKARQRLFHIPAGDYGAAAAIPPDMPCGNAHEVRHNTRRRQPFCAQLRHMVQLAPFPAVLTYCLQFRLYIMILYG